MLNHSFKLNSIEIKNYKKYDDLPLNFKTRFTLIIGENGAGKTTVLDAVATLLGGFLQTFPEISSSQRHSISQKDIKLNFIDKDNNITAKYQTPVIISGHGQIDKEDISIKRIRQNAGKNTATKLPREENLSLFSFSKQFKKDIDDNILPIISYHGTGRLWEQSNKNIASMERLTRLDGYKDCLKPKSNYQDLITWFKKMEFNAFQLQKKIPILEAVRMSIMQSITTLKQKEVERFFYFEKDISIKYVGVEEIERMSNLSDGYRNIIGMVSDIAYRMAILNPHLGLEVTQKTAGIVLIDELDLHLHPKWQKQIVSLLLSLFPKVQFITSSHSPFIIQSMAKDSIIKLDEDSENLSVDARELSIEDIAEDIQKIDLPQMSERKKEMLEVAKEYFEKLDLLEKGEISEEEFQIINTRLDEVSAIYDDNMAYVAFLERKRLISESKR